MQANGIITRDSSISFESAIATKDKCGWSNIRQFFKRDEGWSGGRSRDAERTLDCIRTWGAVIRKGARFLTSRGRDVTSSTINRRRVFKGSANTDSDAKEERHRRENVHSRECSTRKTRGWIYNTFRRFRIPRDGTWEWYLRYARRSRAIRPGSEIPSLLTSWHSSRTQSYINDHCHCSQPYSLDWRLLANRAGDSSTAESLTERRWPDSIFRYKSLYRYLIGCRRKKDFSRDPIGALDNLVVRGSFVHFCDETVCQPHRLANWIPS